MLAGDSTDPVRGHDGGKGASLVLDVGMCGELDEMEQVRSCGEELWGRTSWLYISKGAA